MKDKTIKQLEADIKALYAKKNALREREIKKKIVPRLEKFLGACWKYENSYSVPEKRSDYWFEYKKVLDILHDKDGYVHFIIQQFSVDKYGKLSLVIESDSPHHDARDPYDNWVRITPSEYQLAFVDFWEQLNIRERLKREVEKQS